MLIAALIGCWLWNIADGGDGSPYGQLMAITGVAYIAGVALLRWRGVASGVSDGHTLNRTFSVSPSWTT